MEYITPDGHIVDGKNSQNKTIGGQLDFKWETHNIQCYASHKYTKESGGSQNNQYREQLNLLQCFKKRTQGDIVFFVICDGEFYDEGKMEELRKSTRLQKPYSFACHTEEVVEKLKWITSKYINS